MSLTTLRLNDTVVLMMPRESPEDLVNTAVFCSWCGEVWLRADRSSAFWTLEIRPCETHGGGGLWNLDHCDGAIGLLHGELLKREFLMQTQFIPHILSERSAA